MPISEGKKAYNREYYRKNRDKLIEAAKKNYHDNRERRAETKKAWWLANREAATAKQREWYQKNKNQRLERSREQSRLYRFTKHGLTEQDYLDMSAAQGDLCAICEMPCDVVGKLSIDHCHDTDQVRGLLCKRCNSGLGFFRESIDVLAKATNYLRMWGT